MAARILDPRVRSVGLDGTIKLNQTRRVPGPPHPRLWAFYAVHGGF